MRGGALPGFSVPLLLRANQLQCRERGFLIRAHQLRVAADVGQYRHQPALDTLASALDRPRSWVMLRALRQYLDEEGAEIAEDVESLAELDRGEVVTSEELRRNVREIIAKAEKTRAQHK